MSIDISLFPCVHKTKSNICKKNKYKKIIAIEIYQRD